MRRLTGRVLRRLTPQRLADERGAVAVMVGLMLIPLLGFGAIAVDVASLYSDKAQLQNAADAAALAIGVDCARKRCGDRDATARTALTGNAGAADAADATLRSPDVAQSGSSVTVTMSADQSHWFAPVLGEDSSRVTAKATASWTPTTRGRANFPLAISWCEYQAQIQRYPLSNTTVHRINGRTPLPIENRTCEGPNGGQVRTGYLVTSADSNGVCRTTSTLGGTVRAYDDMYGSRLPSSCTEAYLASLIDSDVLMPVWDQVTGSGTDLRARVYGYAAFHITGYDVYNPGDPALYGYFTYAAQQADDTTRPTTTSAPLLGASSVYLQG